ncbi:aminopeptidase [Pseudomonas sp. RL_15y_Pfl2_60]|uniref:aminopeptidase n=1 Tax=Pseudomonas sp. RL_15y_Pfl2_60 TaxID=3088709 RepID=UPI0030DB73C8
MPPTYRSLLDRIPLSWVPLLLIVLLSGCSSLDYYSQLLNGQVDLLQRRQTISQLLSDPQTDAQLRRRLALSQQARSFASQQLALPDNQSYRVYADVQRPFVLWNVFATPEFSLKPELHCFPIAGCVAYRGYYQQGRARGAAALLKQQGLDVYMGGVEAYSTLGWFDDPLLNTMLRWSDERLVSVIFHELAHQQFYVAGDTEFNESFATFVEQQGLRQWRAEHDQPAADPPADQQREQFTQLVLKTRARLETLYASGKSAEQMRQGKQAEFELLRAEYHDLRQRSWGGVGRYDGWINSPINNAKLLPFGLYDQWVPAFAKLFAEAGGDWPRFYQKVAQLGKLPTEQRKAALELRLMAN